MSSTALEGEAQLLSAERFEKEGGGWRYLAGEAVSLATLPAQARSWTLAAYLAHQGM